MHRKNGPDNAFYFKQFHIRHDRSTMKVGTDGVLLGAWAGINSAIKILDIGTGSGLIALMLAQRAAENVKIDAVEIDLDTFQQATENVKNSPWKEKITTFHTDFQHFSNRQSYDLVVSNPPYFVNSHKAPDLKRTISRHTDKLPFEAIAEGCRRLLHPHGRLCLILPISEGSAFTQIAVRSLLFCTQKVTVRHKSSKPAERLLMEFSFHPAPCQVSDLIMFDEEGKRTLAYQQLVGDFYLSD